MEPDTHPIDRFDMLSLEQCETITNGHCPDCGHRGFVLGPRGGAAMNIECGNLDCRSRFNVAQFMTHAIVMAHRLPKVGQGGPDWEM
jgi:hypothetical protein